MRLLFLGTGTSAGIPMIGCSCAVCTSEDSRDQRLRTSAAVLFRDASGHERVVLLDAGPDLRAQALTHKLPRLDAIFFTHNHMDHILGVDEVRRFNAVMQAPIDVYADSHTMVSLRRVYKHIFEPEHNINDSFVATLVPWEIVPDAIARATPINIHGMLFTPIPLMHGALSILGYRVEPSKELAAAKTPAQRAASPFPLAYCTDVSMIPAEAWPRLTGLTTLVLGALREKPHPTHFTLTQAVNAAEKIKAKQTYFVHMAHELPHGATQEHLPPGMFLSHDGLAIGSA